MTKAVQSPVGEAITVGGKETQSICADDKSPLQSPAFYHPAGMSRRCWYHPFREGTQVGSAEDAVVDGFHMAGDRRGVQRGVHGEDDGGSL